MFPAYWTPQAEQTVSYPTSPRVTFALARVYHVANREGSPPKAGYFAKREDDVTTRSLLFRGAKDTKTRPSALGTPKQEHVTQIEQIMRY